MQFYCETHFEKSKTSAKIVKTPRNPSWNLGQQNQPLVKCLTSLQPVPSKPNPTCPSPFPLLHLLRPVEPESPEKLIPTNHPLPIRAMAWTWIPRPGTRTRLEPTSPVKKKRNAPPSSQRI